MSDRHERDEVLCMFFFFNDTATTEIYTLSLHDALPISSLTLISLLLDAGASVAAYDPEGLDNLSREFGDRVDCVRDAYTVLEGADALIIATEWNEFRSPDFDRMHSLMKSPLIFDGRNVYAVDAMRRHGFEYHSIGRPPVKP